MTRDLRRIAIVTPDVMGPIRNGGVGTSCANLAELLVRRGYAVDLIFADTNLLHRKWIDFYARKKIRLMSLPVPTFELQAGSEWVRKSYDVYEFLRAHHYPLVICPDMGGVSYFSQQAKKTGLALQDTTFLIKFLGPFTWSKLDNGSFFENPFELTLPLMERYVVENADLLQYATPWSLEWCRNQGWKTGNARQALFPFEQTSAQVASPKENKPASSFRSGRRAQLREIVFFGRIETRKGIHSFLKALRLLKMRGALKNRKVTLLGRFGGGWHQDVEEYFETWSQDHEIDLEILTDKQSLDAIAYLKKNKALAVLPSKSETMGLTVVECLASEIPFVASRIEPFEFMLGAKHRRSMFKADDPHEMADVIEAALETNQFILDRPRLLELHAEMEKSWENLIDLSYEAALDNARSAPPGENQNGPAVRRFQPRAQIQSSEEKAQTSISVLIAHHNRSGFLREALTSVLKQTRAPLEVIVYDDASPNDAHRAVIDDLRGPFAARGVSLTLIEGETNRGPSFARNAMADVARGDFVLFMDDDNRALSHEIETLDRMLRSGTADDSGLDVITVALKKFIHGQEDLWLERRWTPIGFDLNGAMFDNIFGDTNFVMRRTLFQELGGFIDDPNLKAEDMHILVKATFKNARMAVCPEPLVEYRVHGGNRSHERVSYERYFHINYFLNRLAKDAGVASLSSLASLLTGWNRRIGFEWTAEPGFLARILKPGETKKVDLFSSFAERTTAKRIEPFGAAHKVYLDSRERLSVSIKDQALVAKEPVFIDLGFVAEKKGTLRTSNPNAEYKFDRGVSQWKVPFHAGDETLWFEFKNQSHVYITQFDLLRLKPGPRKSARVSGLPA